MSYRRNIEMGDEVNKLGGFKPSAPRMQAQAATPVQAPSTVSPAARATGTPVFMRTVEIMIISRRPLRGGFTTAPREAQNDDDLLTFSPHL